MNGLKSPAILLSLIFYSGLVFSEPTYSSSTFNAQGEESEKQTPEIEPEKAPAEPTVKEPSPEKQTSVEKVTKPEQSETQSDAGAVPAKKKPTLSERVQIFIPSEEIDTEKAVAFPTNI